MACAEQKAFCVTGSTYLEMLEIWLFSQIKEDLSNFVFQQDGEPPHRAIEVRRFLNTELPRSWIGRSEPDDLLLHSWPP
ncbi:hypothetical protein AVEN_248201-1, partial [Araneus ventricosus]